MSNPNDDQLRQNQEIDAAIAERLRSTNFGEILASEGQDVVALDDNGRMVRYNSDGTTVPMD